MGEKGIFILREKDNKCKKKNLGGTENHHFRQESMEDWRTEVSRTYRHYAKTCLLQTLNNYKWYSGNLIVRKSDRHQHDQMITADFTKGRRDRLTLHVP